MENKKVVATQKTAPATRPHSEMTVSYFKVGKDDSLTTQDCKYVVNTTHVKDKSYFETGLTYFNYRGIKIRLIKKIEKLEKDKNKADKEENAVLKTAIELELASLNTLKNKVQSAIDALGLTPELEKEYDSDLFCQFMAIPTGWEVMDKKGISEVMAILKETENDFEMTSELKSRLKIALQNVASKFNPIEGKRYYDYKLFINTSFTVGVYRYYKDMSKNSKEDGKYKARFKSEKSMMQYIYNELCGKYQGSLYQTETSDK